MGPGGSAVFNTVVSLSAEVGSIPAASASYQKKPLYIKGFLFFIILDVQLFSILGWYIENMTKF